MRTLVLAGLLAVVFSAGAAQAGFDLPPAPPVDAPDVQTLAAECVTTGNNGAGVSTSCTGSGSGGGGSSEK